MKRAVEITPHVNWAIAAVWLSGREQLHVILEQWTCHELLLALEMLHLERVQAEIATEE